MTTDHMEPQWVHCDTCEERISAQANVCPHCGADFRKMVQRQKIILVGWGIFAFGYLYFIGPAIRDAIGPYNAFDSWMDYYLGISDYEWTPSEFLLFWFAWANIVSFICFWSGHAKTLEEYMGGERCWPSFRVSWPSSMFTFFN